MADWLTGPQTHTSECRQILSCGNTAQHCRWGVLQGSKIAGDLGLEINLGMGENFMFSRKSNVRLHELDVQEENVIVPLFYRI